MAGREYLAMGEKERELIQERLRELTADERRFRINAGMGWVAGAKQTFVITRPKTVQLQPGDVVLRRARPFHGAPEGWADLCGWDSVEITEDMVGKKVAIVAFEEAKTEGVRMSAEQGIFRAVVESMGGRYRIIR